MDNDKDALSRRMARTALLMDAAALERLKTSHVMLFGLGGVGSYAAEALARAGIGKLTLVDADIYVESNLNRQLGALCSTLGKSKAQTECERIRDINPEAQVTAIQAFHLPQEPVAIPADVDFVADAIDTVSAKLDIAQICFGRGMPLIACMGMANRYDPTQIRIGDLFETTFDPLCRVMRRELRRRGVSSLRCVYSTEPAAGPDAENGERPEKGSLPYVPSVAGLYMAYEIVDTICRRDR